MLRFLHLNDAPQSQSALDSSTDSLIQHQAILNTDLYADLEKQLIKENPIMQQQLTPQQ